MEKLVLIKKIFTQKVKHRFATVRLSWKKTVHEVETLWLSSKEKIPTAAVSKENAADRCKKTGATVLPIDNSLGKIHLIH